LGNEGHAIIYRVYLGIYWYLLKLIDLKLSYRIMAEEINEDWISDAIGEGSAKSDSPKYKYPVNKYNYNESIRLDDDDSLIKTRIFNLNEE
jgi:hypothetical protein